MHKYSMDIRLTITILITTLVFLALNSLNVIMVAAGMDNLLDFGSFIASGQLANQSKNPYGVDSPLIFSVEFPELNHAGLAPNLNPPISVLIFQMIAKFPPERSIQIWRVLTILFYLYSIYLLIQHYGSEKSVLIRNIVWALTLAGFWHTIQLGQIYTFLLLIIVGIFVYTEKGNHILAGILLGLLIAIKPNFIFWAIALSMAGQWTIFVTSGITATIVSLIPVYFYGFKIYQQWLEASSLFTPDLLIFPANNSLQGLTARFNSPQAGVFISLGLSMMALLVIYKRKPAIFNIHTLSIIISLLISPIAWTGYTILTLPIFFKPREWNFNLRFAACVLIIPFFLVLALFEVNFFNFIIFGWLYGWALLFLLIDEFTSLRAGSVS